MSTRYAGSAGKNAIERVVAAGLFVVVSPVMAGCAVAVLVSNGWPILYKSARVGRGGRLFHMLKFRTMRQEAGRAITAGGDPRVTGCGSVLRRFKLDELPQLWNVIRGEMSLTGPRPETPEFVDAGNEEWAAILEVRPGMTGAASVEYFNEEEKLGRVSDPVAFYRESVLPENLAIERRYLERCSPAQDVRLVMRTVRRMFRGRAS